MSFFLKKQFNVDANINNTVFLTSLLFEFIEKTDIFFLKQVYFFTNTICTIKKQIQTHTLPPFFKSHERTRYEPSGFCGKGENSRIYCEKDFNRRRNTR